VYSEALQESDKARPVVVAMEAMWSTTMGTRSSVSPMWPRSGDSMSSRSDLPPTSLELGSLFRYDGLPLAEDSRAFLTNVHGLGRYSFRYGDLDIANHQLSTWRFQDLKVNGWKSVYKFIGDLKDFNMDGDEVKVILLEVAGWWIAIE